MSAQNRPSRNRKSIRYSKWSYNEVGYYFITICCYKQQCLFDTNEIKATVTHTWERVPSMKCGIGISLDEYVVMPNHFHGLVRIETDQGSVLPRRFPDKNPNTIAKVISTFKGIVTRQVKALHKAVDSDMPVWKRGYYDRIVRNEIELERVRYYIRENPTRWSEDRENLEVLLHRMTFHG